MPNLSKLAVAVIAGVGVAVLSIYLYEVLFQVLHQLGVSFDTPFSENPFYPFNRYRVIMAALVGLLTMVMLLRPTHWPARRVSLLAVGVWVLSWGLLLLDAAVRSGAGAPSFATQLAWYLLPALTMALTFALILGLLFMIYLRLRRHTVAT